MPLDHPLQWTADYQSQTVRILQQHHNTVFLYHAYRQPWPFLPLRRYEFLYHQMQFFILLMSVFFLRRKNQKVILWIFHPRFDWIRQMTERFFSCHFIVLYDCLDYFSSPLKDEEKMLRKNELSLLENADVVVANSQQLLHLHRAVRPNIFQAPSGFRYAQFQKEKRFARSKNSRSSTPTIGFLGPLNYRIDFPLLYKVCSKNPQWRFIFVGPLYTSPIEDQKKQTQSWVKKILLLKNVLHVDFQNPEDLPEIILDWHVGIIPYDTSLPLNKYCNPLKLMEYFYFGLPVVSTLIPEVRNQYAQYVSFGSNAEEWQKILEKNLRQPPTYFQQQKMHKIAVENSWEKKMQFIAGKI